MKGWRKMRLGDCCEIVSGATPSTAVKAFWEGDICWATPKDLSDLEGSRITTTQRKLTRAGLSSCAASVLPTGSVLFSSRAPIGHVAINAVPMATNQGFKSFIPRPDLVHGEFLYWWLRVNRPYLESMGNGATFKEVSKSVVSRIEVPLPPLAEQRRIADVLNRAEALRAKRRAVLAQLDDLRQSIFLEMFGDPLASSTKAANIRVGSVTRRITYGFTSTMKHLDTGIPIITAKNVRDGFVDFENVHYAAESEFEALTAKSKPQRGDILITKDGTIGRCAVVDTDVRFCINQSVALVQPKHDEIMPAYMVAYLSTNRVQDAMKRMGKGNALAHLQITELAELELPLPSMAAQRDFTRRVAAVQKLKAAHRASLAELDALFASLQRRAFRGEL